MSFWKSLFGGNARATNSTTAVVQPSSSHPVSLRSPDHPAHALALEGDSTERAELVQIIDRALILAPNDENLLYARASALNGDEFFYGPNLDAQTKTAIEQLAKVNPEHFYVRARRLSGGFARPMDENWENLLYFTHWTTTDRSLKGLMPSRLSQEKHVQIVRNCLTPTVAVVWGADRSISEKVRRMRWELRWVKTPHGMVAAHYLIMDCGDDTLRNEGFLPHSISNPPSPMDGYSLLQLLAQSNDCFLVLCDGSDDVFRNELFSFPESLKRTLQTMKSQLNQIGPCKPSDPMDRATKWYMDNTNIKSINF
jgi:hypothetical protein